uniref:Uncharacterized protein n=1 Tax=Echeneis naucrates TaxID=173247 RepID=A0A665WSR4_ECHNA
MKPLKGNVFTDNTDLQCSICLDAFIQPVTTPCGHNYCQACITGYWDSSHPIQCPLCKKQFSRRPQLQVNTEFRDMVEYFSNMRVRAEDQIAAKPGEIPCDICPDLRLKAQKTCMVCLASYCQIHLEPHQRVATLKKHQLLDPVSNLEDRVCKKHGKLFEVFCQTDQMCICFMCLKDDHAMHEAVPLEQVLREMKAQLEDVTSEMRMIEDIKTKSIKEIKSSAEQRQQEFEKEIAIVDEVFASFMASLQRSQVKAVELIQEKQKETEKQAEAQVSQLEQEVDELRRRRSKMEQLLRTEDDFQFVQSWPSIHVSAVHKDLFHPLSPWVSPFPHDVSYNSQLIYVGMVQKAVAQMEKKLSNEMEILFHDLSLSNGCEGIQQLAAAWDAVDVTLDPYTANGRFTVSQDGKQLINQQGRFQQVFNALFFTGYQGISFAFGKDGYSSGRFYYEVQVSGSQGWTLGVAKESFMYERVPNIVKGGWTLTGVHFEGGFVSHCVNSSSLCLKQSPKKLGVFVDYEKGEVSFYDVDTRTQIYTYTECTFTETIPAGKAILYSLAGRSCSDRQKLYPVFSILGNNPNDVLTITPVGYPT